MELKPVKGLKPFTRFLMTIGELPSSYLVSMTYEEQLIWFCNYLEKTVIPTVNNNAEAVIELQNLFIELKSYVDNYFESLDVQEEINNKLDDMAEAGTLATILADYVNMNAVFVYDTIADMAGAETIGETSSVYCLGKDTYNDGKGAFYKVRATEPGDDPDGYNLVTLTNIADTVAERLPDYEINEINSTLSTLTTTTIPGIQDDINSINNTTIPAVANQIYDYPFYNVLENGGYDDGTTDNTSVLTSAYSNGYNKFYFPQNEDGNAVYSFDDAVDFTNYEIMTDEGVVLSFKNPYCITKGKYITDVKTYYRDVETYCLIPKNIPDLFNSCQANIDYNKDNFACWSDVSNCTLIIYDFNNDGHFKIHSNPITSYYTNDGLNYKLTNNPTFNAVCVPFTEKRNCIETNTSMNSTLYGVICDTTTGYGIYWSYNGNTIGYYAEDKQYHTLTELNIHKHNKPNNNFGDPMSYKMKYNNINRVVEFYINDSLVGILRLWFTPNYFGYGTITEGTSFTRMSGYYQEHVPMRYKIKALVLGDSRFDSSTLGRSYSIEDILKNSLAYNGINNLTIDNKSISGYTLYNINNLLQTQDPDEYDIVIIEGGINDYQSSATHIANTTASIINYCVSNGMIPILTTCIPTAPTGLDGASGARATVYYMIENAMNIGFCTTNPAIGKFIDNISGLTTDDTILPISPDGVHPVNVGIIEMAKGITQAVLTIQ